MYIKSKHNGCNLETEPKSFDYISNNPTKSITLHVLSLPMGEFYSAFILNLINKLNNIEGNFI